MDWSEAPEVIRPTPEEVATIPEAKYEYLDHPADVQIHAWGDNLREAFEQSAMGMFGYMTDLETVDVEEVRELEAEAEDLQGLLFHFLDECLFIFACEPFFIARKVVITEWLVGGASGGSEETKQDEEVKEGGGGSEGKEENEKSKEGKDGNGERNEQGDKETSVGGTGGEATSGTQCTGSGTLRVRARLYGEEFDLEKHPQGTEVKAITYASMQIYDKPGQHEVFVIIDI